MQSINKHKLKELKYIKLYLVKVLIKKINSKIKPIKNEPKITKKNFNKQIK